LSEAREYMARALDLAEGGRGSASPNPLVGAVLVREDRVVGEGFHRRPGEPHAEAVALAAAAGRARGATLYVTLEPCAHQGRTPPCADALVEAGVSRVVVATGDPHPLVDGRGILRLRGAGIEVEVGLCEAEARRQNEAFFVYARHGRPFFVVKSAASLDGKVAARDGSARWITGEAAREDAHRLRGELDAVMVGVGTILADDPLLTCRGAGFAGRAPWRVVVDSRGRTPAGARVLTDRAAPTVIATTAQASEETVALWQSAGAKVWRLPARGDGSVDLGALGARLGLEEITSVLVEGGPTLAAAMVAEGLADKFVVYVAPKLLGGTAPSLIGGAGVAGVTAAWRLEFDEVTRVGEDIRIVAYPAGEGAA